MTTAKVVLGKNIEVDVGVLLRSNLAIVGNSGSGKTLAARQLLEALQDKTAEVIFDTSGEFHTLREHFDYLLVGTHGEMPADPTIAPDVARFVREKGCRVIVDLSELPLEEQQGFIERFGDALLKLPRALWKIPLVVFVDEVHLFAPQEERPRSRKTIGNLATLGRKQRICTVVATQRLAEASKQLMGSINNRMYGRFADAVDLGTASKQLGFAGRSRWNEMQEFAPGDFFVKGPAFSVAGVIRGRTSGKTKSRHIDPSEEFQLSPAPASRAIRSLAKELADKHSAQAARTKADETEVARLRARVTELEGGAELRRLREKIQILERDQQRGTNESGRASAVYEAKLGRMQRQIGELEEAASRHRSEIALAEAKGHQRGWKEASAAVDRLLRALEQTRKTWQTWETEVELLRKAMAAGGSTPLPETIPAARHDKAQSTTARPLPQPRPQPATKSAVRSNGRDDLRPSMRRILTALAQYGELDQKSLALFSKQSITSSGFHINLAEAKRQEWIEGGEGASYRITSVGKAVLGPFEALPTGAALIDYWASRFGAGAGRILRTVLEAGPGGIDVEDLATAVGLSTKSSAFHIDIGRFRKLKLFERGRPIRASTTLLRMA